MRQFSTPFLKARVGAAPAASACGASSEGRLYLKTIRDSGRLDKLSAADTLDKNALTMAAFCFRSSRNIASPLIIHSLPRRVAAIVCTVPVSVGGMSPVAAPHRSPEAVLPQSSSPPPILQKTETFANRFCPAPPSLKIASPQSPPCCADRLRKHPHSPFHTGLQWPAAPPIQHSLFCAVGPLWATLLLSLASFLHKRALTPALSYARPSDASSGIAPHDRQKDRPVSKPAGLFVFRHEPQLERITTS